VKLVERIRNFIRPAQADYQFVNMKILLDDVTQLLAYEIQQQKIQFQFDVDAAECWVHGDHVQLSQIVLNVYRNAMQAMALSADKVILSRWKARPRRWFSGCATQGQACRQT